MTKYSISRTVPYNFETAITRITEELNKQGFGILTTIDVQAKMQEKLEKDMSKYTILGACNPAAAYNVLQQETEIGLLLPCNVIVYDSSDGTHVAAIKPTTAMNMIKNEEVTCTAGEIEKKLHAAISAL